MFLLSILVSMCYDVSADVTFEADTLFQYNPATVNITLAEEMTFSAVEVQPTTIRFNETYFNITNTDGVGVNITLNDLQNLTGAVGNTYVLNMTVACDSGTTWFNLTGFKSSRAYQLFRDGALNDTLTSTADGNLSFNATGWSEHTFVLRDGDGNYTTQIRIVYDVDISRTRGLGETVFQIIGLVLIIGCVLLIVGLLYKFEYI